MNKKNFVALTLVLLAAGAFADSASSVVVIGPGKTTSPACATGTCDGTADATTGTFDISKARFIRVQAYCSSGPCTNVMTVNIRAKRNNSTATTPPFQAVISCTNVTTGGVCADGSTGYMNVPVGMELNVQQSGTGAGTVQAILETHILSP